MITDRLISHFRLSSVPNVGPKAHNELIKLLSEDRKTIEDLFLLKPNDIAKVVAKARLNKVEPSLILKSSKEAAEAVLLKVEESGAKVITIEAEEYPLDIKNALNENAPPLLYAFGNFNLLNKKAVAIVGSRNASEESISIAQKFSRELSKADITVVSGYAPGIDTTAHEGALEGIGGTIVVLSFGILEFKWKQNFISKGSSIENALIISEFNPKLKWNTWSAMQRNKTVVALSDGIFAVEFKADGGTFATMKEANKYKKPLLVLDNDLNREMLKNNNLKVAFLTGRWKEDQETVTKAISNKIVFSREEQYKIF